MRMMASLPRLNSRRPDQYFPKLITPQFCGEKYRLSPSFHPLGRPSTATAFSEPPLVAYSQGHNLLVLVHSRMQEPSSSPSSQLCNRACSKPRCNTCAHVLLTSSVTFLKGNCIIKEELTCSSHITAFSSNIPHLKTLYCNMKYIWETVAFIYRPDFRNIFTVSPHSPTGVHSLQQH